MDSIDLWFYGLCLGLGVLMSIPGSVGRTGHRIGRVRAPRVRPKVHSSLNNSQQPQHPAAQLSFFNPIVFASMLGGFGAIGLITRGLGINRWVTMAIAAGGGFALALVVFRVFVRYVLSAEGGSAPERDAAVGNIARVTVTIPAHGFGAISTVINGKHQTMSARSQGSETFAKGSEVLIIALERTTAVVQVWEMKNIEHRT